MQHLLWESSNKEFDRNDGSFEMTQARHRRLVTHQRFVHKLISLMTTLFFVV